MALSEKLTEIKSETDALIDYSNGVTGAGDTRLGDAVRTLASGYGGGGGRYELLWSYTLSEHVDELPISRITEEINLEYGQYSELLFMAVSNSEKTGSILPRIILKKEGNDAYRRLRLIPSAAALNSWNAIGYLLIQLPSLGDGTYGSGVIGKNTTISVPNFDWISDNELPNGGIDIESGSGGLTGKTGYFKLYGKR